MVSPSLLKRLCVRRQKLVGALMHECVLIPEGVSDVAWLEALQTALELHQGGHDAGEGASLLSTFVGIVPTKVSPGEMDFGLGSFYAHSYPHTALNPGDDVQIDVNGGSIDVGSVR